MRRVRGAAAVCGVAVLVLLAGCDREPVRTVVIPPRDAASAAAPVASTAAAPVPSGPREASEAASTAATPVPSGRSEASEAAATMGGPAASAPAAVALVPARSASALPPTRWPGDAAGAALLAGRALMVPVAGMAPTDIPDTYAQVRGHGPHEALDLMAPRGTPVVAVDDGRIAKLFTSKPGGLTVYQFDPSGQLAYYYAHLDRYAEGLHEGETVRRGALLGYVGSTGNADPAAPHLHFTVFRLGPEKRWWQGEAVNPWPSLRAGVAAPANVAAR